MTHKGTVASNVSVSDTCDGRPGPLRSASARAARLGHPKSLPLVPRAPSDRHGETDQSEQIFMKDQTADPKVLEAAAHLARDELAPRAADYDREAKNPVESWRALGRAGLLGATIPRGHGGLALDMPTYVGVIRTLSGACASTAMTLHMHSTVMRFVDALGTDAQKGRYFPEVVAHGKLFGSWGSEPAVSLSRTLLMETSIRETDEGWVIDGMKHFCTMALGASYYMVWCAVNGGTDMGKAFQL